MTKDKHNENMYEKDTEDESQEDSNKDQDSDVSFQKEADEDMDATDWRGECEREFRFWVFVFIVNWMNGKRNINMKFRIDDLQDSKHVELDGCEVFWRSIETCSSMSAENGMKWLNV